MNDEKDQEKLLAKFEAKLSSDDVKAHADENYKWLFVNQYFQLGQ